MAAEVNFKDLMSRITTVTGEPCEFYEGIQNDLTVKIQPGQLVKTIEILRDEFDCYHLTGITAQVRDDQREFIEVIYNFWQNTGVSLLMTLPAENPELPSILPMLLGADFYEREVAEMFGIRYTGRGDTPALLLPEDWDQGPPFIRKEDTHEE